MVGDPALVLSSTSEMLGLYIKTADELLAAASPQVHIGKRGRQLGFAVVKEGCYSMSRVKVGFLGVSNHVAPPAMHLTGELAGWDAVRQAV
jgi:hypothetical protein